MSLASLEQLERTVNAYTLTFAVFLLTGAALGDRFGRKRMFIAGLGIFVAASAAAAIGAWGGIGRLAVALGPVVGGAVVEGISWQWIFWLNVPIGIALIPLASRELAESHGPNSAIRELGGVFGVAVLASIFASYGGYESGTAFVDGLVPAIWAGASLVALGALAALAIPPLRGRRAEARIGEPAASSSRA